METLVFDKTEKGRAEIATRAHQLPHRMRTLLLLVDGKQNGAALLEKVAGLGLDGQNFQVLLEQGFIQPQQAALPVPVPADSAVTIEPDAVLPEGQTQFQAIYGFYTETIKSTVGLRGYMLQLKVEKAACVEDLRALRQPYLDAVLNVKGNEIARSLRVRLDELLCPGEEAPAATVADVRPAPSQ